MCVFGCGDSKPFGSAFVDVFSVEECGGAKQGNCKYLGARSSSPSQRNPTPAAAVLLGSFTVVWDHRMREKSWLQINHGTAQFQHFRMQFEGCKIQTRLSTIRRDMEL